MSFSLLKKQTNQHFHIVDFTFYPLKKTQTHKKDLFTLQENTKNTNPSSLPLPPPWSELPTLRLLVFLELFHPSVVTAAEILNRTAIHIVVHRHDLLIEGEEFLHPLRTEGFRNRNFLSFPFLGFINKLDFLFSPFCIVL